MHVSLNRGENPNMKRRLTLNSETLAELTVDDLSTVRGGAQALSDRAGRCTLDDSYLICRWMTHNTCDNTCDGAC